MPPKVVRTRRPLRLDGWAVSRVERRGRRLFRRNSVASLPARLLKRGTVRSLEWVIVAGADKEEWPPLLRAGFHELDLNARQRLCVERFGDSVMRPRIMQNLELKIAEINYQSIPGQIWIDGSFLTEKINPDDADIALILSRTTHRGLSLAQRTWFNQFRGTSLYDQYRIDNYGIVLDPNQAEGHWLFAYWLKQFGFSRSDEMKGIVRIQVPFVVRP